MAEKKNQRQTPQSGGEVVRREELPPRPSQASFDKDVRHRRRSERKEKRVTSRRTKRLG